MNAFTFIDGEPTTSEFYLDRGFCYGDGVFETMRCRDGNIALVDLHLRRLQTSCERLRMPLNRKIFDLSLARCLEKAGPDNSVKLIACRSLFPRGSYPLQDVDARLIAHVQSYAPRAVPNEGIRLRMAPGRLAMNPSLAGLKHMSRLAYIEASLGVEPAADEEVLFQDFSGKVVECMHHNIFILKEGELITPPLASAGVEGVCRRWLLDTVAPSLNIRTKVEKIALKELFDCEGAFVCNALEGLVPVDSVDERKLPNSVVLASVIEKTREIFTR